MNTRVANLQCKENINVCNGESTDYINNMELDIGTGQLVAIVVHDPWSLSCPFSKSEKYVVPMLQTEKIGGNFILVHFEVSPTLRKRQKERCRRVFV